MLGIIVEASGNSGDLPNRILFKFGDFTALERILNVCISSYYAHRVILSMPSADRGLISGGIFSEGLPSISGISFAGKSVETSFIGRQEEQDLRLYQTAVKFGLEHVVKVDADDVLLQTKHLDALIHNYYSWPAYHRLSPEQHPKGVAAEICPFWMLASTITSKPPHQSMSDFIKSTYGFKDVKNANGYVLKTTGINLKFDSRQQVPLLSRVFDELDRGVEFDELIREIDEQS